MGLCNEKPQFHADRDGLLTIFSADIFETIPLVSFDRSIQSLIPLIPTIEDYVQLIKQKCLTPADGLTSDQSASIMLFSLLWQPIDRCLYTQLNQILLATDPAVLKPWYSYLKLLLSALIQLPSHDQVVYRGSTSDLHEEYPLDAVIRWKDLALCTSSIDHLQSNSDSGMEGLRTIYTVRGNSVKNIHPHTYLASNHLMVFLPGTKFQVIGSFHQTIHLHYIMLQEIEPSPLLQSQSSSNTKLHRQRNKSSNLFTR